MFAAMGVKNDVADYFRRSFTESGALTRVAMFLNLSEPGVDYGSGGAAFRTADGWVDTFAPFRIGDIMAWRYDLIHSVIPVDPAGPPSWTGDDGFWIYALEGHEVHKASRTTPDRD